MYTEYGGKRPCNRVSKENTINNLYSEGFLVNMVYTIITF